MTLLFAGSIILSLASSMGSASAQAETLRSIDSLYEEGQQQMAPHWRGLGKTHNAAIFIRTDMKKTDSGHAVWMHHELLHPEYVEKEKAYLSARERMLIDCKSSRVGTSNSAYYVERFGVGEVVATNKVKKAEMSEALPDSIEELLIKAACETKSRDKSMRKVKVTKIPSE